MDKLRHVTVKRETANRRMKEVEMESARATSQQPVPHAVIMQMVTGAWATKVMSELTRLGVPDILHRYGSLSAADMVTQHGIQAESQALHRALRACAALGIVTEDESGKFGPTPLSHVLTKEAPGSLKRLVQYTGNLLWRVWTGLPEGLH